MTKDEIISLAQLAKLRLSESEIQQFQDELNGILAYVEVLDGVDTENLKPTSQVTGLQSVMRDDIVRDQPAHPDELLACVPNTQKNYIKVRRMI